jgi:hypothetical protein
MYIYIIHNTNNITFAYEDGFLDGRDVGLLEG